VKIFWLFIICFGIVAFSSSAQSTGIDKHCPPEMKHIQGNFCTSVKQNCIKYMEDPAKNKFARCQEFAPSVCVGKRVPMDFCIDTEEHYETDNMPTNNVSWTQAKQICEQEGKELANENQWTFACEGEQLYPYTTGYTRPSDRCNFDKTDLTNAKGEFINKSVSIKENPQCTSPFGVHNMNGNIDEWVVLDIPYYSTSGVKMMSGLKSGWWGGLRDMCSPKTVGHDEFYHDTQTGFRCSKAID
jgi:formylglycine-generating enzyme